MKKFTVTQITTQIKNILTATFNEPVIVIGEISNFSVSPSGHAYFTLKDEKSQIKVVFFKRMLMLNNYAPKNGDKVEVIGDLTVYEADGVYQIVARKVTYSTEGEFYKKFEETKRILEAEGLFDRKRGIVEIVKNIAVLTSPSGAAIKDFIKVLKQNSIGINVDIWPVQVQGQQAIQDIIHSIDRINRFSHRYDLLILMRGGGSLEDLIIFNDEHLARALYNSKIPTISAIGHERDITICDFIADLRVSTPTAAAETISKPFLEYRNRLKELLKQIKKLLEHNIDKKYQTLDKYVTLINYKNPINVVKHKKDIVYKIVKDIISSISLKIDREKNSVENCLYKIRAHSPINFISDYKTKISYIEKNIVQLQYNRLKFNISKVDALLDRLKILNPANVLERGYTIVYNNKIPVTSIKDVKLEDNLEIQFKDGYSNVFVTGKKMEEFNG